MDLLSNLGVDGQTGVLAKVAELLEEVPVLNTHGLFEHLESLNLGQEELGVKGGQAQVTLQVEG